MNSTGMNWHYQNITIVMLNVIHLCYLSACHCFVDNLLFCFCYNRYFVYNYYYSTYQIRSMVEICVWSVSRASMALMVPVLAEIPLSLQVHSQGFDATH